MLEGDVGVKRPSKIIGNVITMSSNSKDDDDYCITFNKARTTMHRMGGCGKLPINSVLLVVVKHELLSPGAPLSPTKWVDHIEPQAYKKYEELLKRKTTYTPRVVIGSTSKMINEQD